jgi:hypothetical protein
MVVCRAYVGNSSTVRIMSSVARMHPSPTPSSSRAERHLQAGAYYVTFTMSTVLLSMMLFLFVGYLVVYTIGRGAGVRKSDAEGRHLQPTQQGSFSAGRVLMPNYRTVSRTLRSEQAGQVTAENSH